MLKARFAAVRIRIADGAPPRIGDMGQQHMPGEEAWLIGEHRSTGERKYYLSQPRRGRLPQDPGRGGEGAVGLRTGSPAAQGGTEPRPLRRTILDRAAPTRPHGDDRLRLPSVPPAHPGGREKKSLRPTASTQPAGDPTGHLGSHVQTSPAAMSALQSGAQTESAKIVVVAGADFSLPAKVRPKLVKGFSTKRCIRSAIKMLAVTAIQRLANIETLE